MLFDSQWYSPLKALYLILFLVFFCRGTGPSLDAVVGMSFFTARIERGPKSLFFVTLGMNGHIRLWMGSNIHGALTWTALQSSYVNRNLADGVTDSSMLLKKSTDVDQHDLPFFVIYIPNDGFRIYSVVKGVAGQVYGAPSVAAAAPGSTQLMLNENYRIDFKDQELVDFTVNSEYIHVLVINPEEEIEWDVKSYNLKETLSPRFNVAFLEPLHLPDVQMTEDSVDPKEFYMDLVFSKCSFSKNTIIQALTVTINYIIVLIF